MDNYADFQMTRQTKRGYRVVAGCPVTGRRFVDKTTHPFGTKPEKLSEMKCSECGRTHLLTWAGGDLPEESIPRKR